MMVIANVFPKLQTVKNFVRPLCEKRRFGKPLEKENLKVSKTIAEYPWEIFYHFFSSFWEKVILKMSPPVLGEI